MKLKVSLLSQLKMLLGLIFMTIACFSFIYLGRNSFDLELIFFLLIPYWLMFFFPVVILHFNYLHEVKGNIFEISKNEILKKNKLFSIKHSMQDIEEIIFFMSGARNRGNGGLAHSCYYYAKIKLKDNSSFVITSLYSNKIDKILEQNFENVKITTENVFYPIIRSIKNN